MTVEFHGELVGHVKSVTDLTSVSLLLASPYFHGALYTTRCVEGQLQTQHISLYACNAVFPVASQQCRNVLYFLNPHIHPPPQKKDGIL